MQALLSVCLSAGHAGVKGDLEAKGAPSRQAIAWSQAFPDSNERAFDQESGEINAGEATAIALCGIDDKSVERGAAYNKLKYCNGLSLLMPA